MIKNQSKGQKCNDELLIWKELSQHIVGCRKYGPRLRLADADQKTFECDPTWLWHMMLKKLPDLLSFCLHSFFISFTKLMPIFSNFDVHN